MTDHHNSDPIKWLTSGPGQFLAAIIAGAYLLSADYPPAALGALIALFFAVYVWMRLMVFFENDRFSPKRVRVGLTWALIGLDDGVREFDPRPVRVYFALLVILFAGLIIKPILQAVIS